MLKTKIIYYNENGYIFKNFRRIKKEESVGSISVDEQAYLDTLMCPGHSDWVVKNGSLMIQKKAVDDNSKKQFLLDELDQINKWFFENDWKINKIVVNEWSHNDSRYLDYLTERKAKRKRQDAILLELNI